MEPLTKFSRNIIASDTSAIDVPDTIKSFQEYYTRVVNTSTPATPDSRTFSFDILPSVNGELHLCNSDLVTKWQLRKADGSPIPASTQVGIIQAMGLLAWESCSLTVAGAPFLQEYTSIDHAQYINLLFGHNEKERRSILHSLGWAEDEPGRFDSIAVAQDPKCR